VTIAVANAGIYPNCPVLEMTPEEWDRVIETNMRGVFLTCQAAARRMVAAETPGKIITVSSGAHNSGRKGAAHNCASKAGVVMFTKVLAMELGEHGVQPPVEATITVHEILELVGPLDDSAEDKAER
jgi:NAD(P)-dependent dehydrogenase (short-subunit alcohol dehydrogenase family)